MYIYSYYYYIIFNKFLYKLIIKMIYSNEKSKTSRVFTTLSTKIIVSHVEH